MSEPTHPAPAAPPPPSPAALARARALGLTGNETILFARMMDARGLLVSKHQLHLALYPDTAFWPASNSVEVLIGRIRKKLAALAVLGERGKIVTARRRGYRFVDEADEAAAPGA